MEGVNKTIKERENKESDKQEKDKGNIKKIKIGWGDYIKIIVVLGVVIVIIYGLSLIIKKSLNIRGKIGDGANIIVNQPLGPGKWIQVVYIGGKFLILGVTNDRISLLTEVTDPKEIERYEIMLNEKKIESGNTFVDIINDFFKNTFKNKAVKRKFDYEIDSVDFLKKQKKRLDDINGDNK